MFDFHLFIEFIFTECAHLFFIKFCKFGNLKFAVCQFERELLAPYVKRPQWEIKLFERVACAIPTRFVMKVHPLIVGTGVFDAVTQIKIIVGELSGTGNLRVFIHGKPHDYAWKCVWSNERTKPFGTEWSIATIKNAR